MPTPTRITAYPLEFRASLDHVLAHGSLFIPTPSPAALRLHYYGYFAALRRETGPDATLPDSFSIFIKHKPEPGILISLKESTLLAVTIRKAIQKAKSGEAPSHEEDSAENPFLDVFNRLAAVTPNPKAE